MGGPKLAPEARPARSSCPGVSDIGFLSQRRRLANSRYTLGFIKFRQARAWPLTSSRAPDAAIGHARHVLIHRFAQPTHPLGRTKRGLEEQCAARDVLRDTSNKALRL